MTNGHKSPGDIFSRIYPSRTTQWAKEMVHSVRNAPRPLSAQYPQGRQTDIHDRNQPMERKKKGDRVNE